MSSNTGIQWTDATVNFWTGCTKVSPGCKFCYMYRDKERYGLDPTQVIRTSDKTFYAALNWREPKKIFTCSWSDFFIEEADAWRQDAWNVIRQTPQHIWQILTKRPERILQCLPEDWGEGYPNVWLGVSVENQAMASKRLPIFLYIPAAIHFVSYEPALAPVNFKEVEVSAQQLFGYNAPADLTEKFNCLGNKHSDFDFAIDWVIIGGESGNDTGKYKYRPCQIKWIEHVVWHCQKNDVAVFVKQLGTHLANELKLVDRHGGDIDEWVHESIKIREYPEL